jgi:hypothetical protein
MNNKQPKYLTPTEAAAKLHTTEGVLANWRAKKMGPRWVKVGGKIMYPSDAVSTYVCKQISTAYWENKTPVALGWKAPQSARGVA